MSAVFDGHELYFAIDVPEFVVHNNIHLFQLPSHSYHVIQALAMCVFGVFKREIADVLITFLERIGMKMPMQTAWLWSYARCGD